MNGADAVARILQQEGVEFLFAYPNHPVINAAAALGIRPIIARTEKTLLNMTDGFTRMTNGRQIGVCVVQGGPGIENAFGGVAQAARRLIHRCSSCRAAPTSIAWVSRASSIRSPPTAP